MKKLFAFLLTAAFVFSACGESIVQTGIEGYAEKQEMSYLYSGEIPSFNYYTQGAQLTYAAVAMLVDGLVEFDKYGIQIPAVAHSWESSADGLVWTFHLRDDVTWVDHQGNYIAHTTAHDFVTAARYNLNQDNASYYSYYYFENFVNAQEYYDSTAPDYDGELVDFETVGVKALDDWTLQYTLLEPVPYFLSLMNWVAFYPAYGPFLEEAGAEFGISNDKLLYNGAMILETFRPQNQRIYVKNKSYYLADEIYLTKMHYQFNAEAPIIAPEMFRRGEITYADISTVVLDEWLDDPVLSTYVRPVRSSWFSYFYIFNFDPKFPDEYEPENWSLAVNNRNFRKAVFHAYDRLSAVYTWDPHNPAAHIIQTVVPPYFTSVNGIDYTQIGELGRLANELSGFDAELAQEYRDAARAELETAGATFPIKVLMPYNTSWIHWGQRVQVVKQNLERVLGTDFIEIVIFDAPPTNFLQDNRRNGRFAFLEANWGPDVTDPATYVGPFAVSRTYNKPNLAEGYLNDDGLFIYWALLEEAKVERHNIQRRYELFAAAEAFLIEEAFIMPFTKSVPSWVASYLNPFHYNYSTGSNISVFKLNNVRMLASPMDAEQFIAAREQWEAERTAALLEAAGR